MQEDAIPVVRNRARAGEDRSGRARRAVRLATTAALSAAAVVAALLTAVPAATQPLAAAATADSTQRGPDPTIQSIEASRGPFATAQLSVAPGNGFHGGVVYYPTDTSLGTWGALVIVPGYTALCANEEAWMGPWLSSFGFVVLCMETNSPNDWDTTRGQEALAALTWLTNSSPVKSEIDPNRLAVMGHSMGGGGTIYALEHRPSLRAGIGLAPYSPSQNMSTDTVPTLVLGGQDDTTVTPSYLSGLYATLPASTPKDFAQIAGASHGYYTTANNVMMKLVIPWLKIFVDSDGRYEQFLCPSLPDPYKISEYQPKCPYITSSGGGGGSGYVRFQNHATGLFIDGEGRTTNGSNAGQWSNSTSNNQQWQIVPDGSYVRLQNRATGLFLDGEGRTSNGSAVGQWTSSTSNNQQWTETTTNGYVRFQNRATGLYIDGEGRTANGSDLGQWSNSTSSNQEWTIVTG